TSAGAKFINDWVLGCLKPLLTIALLTLSILSFTAHGHPHSHHLEHSHVHNDKSASSITPWALFAIFVFGPCEPLIPILMYPAAKNGFFEVLLVVFVF
ncbi:unnamed protein product, partial [marine sediment metagenome]